ncbi:MAG: shikimate dehydrogenase [Akkermansiaceae bacterium]|jgi:shikimate dehydrogenase
MIDGNTRIMGVIGDPVAQVRTPEAINPIFAAKGANIQCIPLHISANNLATAFAGLKALETIIGFGVTLPHKQNVLPLCDSLDPVAVEVGAVNVVRREADGSFRGYQFDGLGFVRGLRAAGHNPAGRTCLIIGAGGAARAIVRALLDAGAAQVRITNRTTEKAKALAEATADDRVSAGPPRPASGDLVINATSLGMSASDPLPIDPDLIDTTMTVAEVVAKPEFTRLLTEARARRAVVHSGLHMIHHQVDLIATHMLELYGAAD